MREGWKDEWKEREREGRQDEQENNDRADGGEGQSAREREGMEDVCSHGCLSLSILAWTITTRGRQTYPLVLCSTDRLPVNKHT